MVDVASTVSIKRIKYEMVCKRKVWEIENIFKILENGSESLQYYVYVFDNTNTTYGKASSKVDSLVMRLRLGYKYIWQYTEGNGIPCKLCNEPSSHTLYHYVMECNELSEFRSREITTATEQVCHF